MEAQTQGRGMPVVTHPDELVKLICALAKDHGYGVTEIELCGKSSELGALPRHSYSVETLQVTGMDGKTRRVQP
jgi:F0F1-type ATP synthase epsilon subunit